MTSNEESEENSSRGNEWEVVSLTASTYAAAPGPREAELKEGEKVNTYSVDEAETSRALFLSGHFLFPPSQHENLLLQHDDSEIDAEQGNDVPAASEGGKSSAKDEEKHAYEGLNVQDEFPGLQFFNGKDKKLSIPGADFDESQILQESNLIDKEQNLFETSKYLSFHSESGLSESTLLEESMNIPQQLEPSPDISESPRIDETVDSRVPCGAWWKRRASSMYTNAKEANAFWSIFIAAAVMGIVILGKRWQQERWQTLQLKWHLTANDQKMSRMVGQMSGLKDIIAAGQRPGSVFMSSSSN